MMKWKRKTKNNSRMRFPTATGLLGLMAILMLAPMANAHAAGESDEHGTTSLTFESREGDCFVGFEARHVTAGRATLTIERPGTGPHTVTEHEAELEGAPEEEGSGFRFEAGPFDLDEEFYRFALQLETDGEAHSLHHLWSGAECAPDARLRVHQDQESGAVLDVQGCSFFIEGQHTRSEEGVLEVEGRHSGDLQQVDVTSEDTEDDELVGHRFFVGTVTVDLSGTYEIRFFADGETPDASTTTEVEECSTEPPACPTNVRADPSEDSIRVRWDLVQDALQYRLYRVSDEGDMLVAEVDHPVIGATDDGLEPGETHEYRVTAVGEQGESRDCPTIEAMTEGEPAEECPPVSLMAMANDDESVTITADGLENEARLLRAAGGGNAEQVAVLGAGNATYQDTETEAGVTYTYHLVVDGETCAQVEVTAIPVFPSVLAGVAATSLGVVGYAMARRRR